MSKTDRLNPVPEGNDMDNTKAVAPVAATHGAEEAGGGQDTIAVLPLRDIVVFPHMIVPLFVGREKSVRALEAVTRSDKQILLVAQKNAAQDDPAPGDIYR